MTRRMGIAGLMSVLLHALIAAAILLRLPPRGDTMPEAPDKPVMVELVMEEQTGTGETQVRPPTPRPQEASQATPPPPQPQPEETEPAPTPPEARPVPPAPPTPPRPAASASPPPPVPEINIGGTDSDSNAIVTGSAVIPAKPDAQARNRPPAYPEDAARRGQQGAVLLNIHVTPDGLTDGIDVVRSSGAASLDRAAIEAARKWRFLPAVKDGVAIPYDFQMNCVFAFN